PAAAARDRHRPGVTHRRGGWWPRSPAGQAGPMRVIVIGGGIVGTSAAYHLAKRGVSTTLVDASRTGQATAAGAGVVFPWPFPWDPPPMREFALQAAAHYPGLMRELAEDGQVTGYRVVGGISAGTDPGLLDRDLAVLRELRA